MQVFEVGGAVRDGLLGLPVQDRDYVVVGATPEQMVAQGYRPVGRDFPVFLHPQTHEEYALARTERKNGRGYKGFAIHASPDVTLEEDLARRDLTINAIARAADGTLVDPYGGVADLRAGVFRHVSDAFAEDPVRVLRLARFAARFPTFVVAQETVALVCAMATAGELDFLVPERVWQELARGLLERHPERMFDVLRAGAALGRVAPELEAMFSGVGTGAGTLEALSRAAAASSSLPVRFAVLVHGLGADVAAALSARLKVPVECRDLGLLAARYHALIIAALGLDAAGMVGLFEAVDALRRPARFFDLLAVCGFMVAKPSAAAARLRAALDAARDVDAGAVARAGDTGDVRARIHAARVAAVADGLRSWATTGD